MSLQNLIREGNYATAQEAFNAITTSSVTVTDDQLYTWAGVALLVGPVGAESLRVALESNGMGWVVHQLGGSGIQLSNELVQQALLGFSQARVPGCSVLAAQGISQKAPWQVDGIATEPTLQQVTEAFDAELRYRAYQSIVERATAAMEAAGLLYRSSSPTPQEITTAGEEAFEVV
jgi:hypothetical protein